MVALIMLTLSVFLSMSLADAQEPETITVWTDKSEYAPGETGTLYIVFYNNQGQNVTIEKINITFESWRAYKADQWEGNQTIEVNEALVAGQILQKYVSFTVPTDGRAVSTNATVKAHADVYIPEKGCPIFISETPLYMEQIVTLFTVQVVLLIVCTIIIAATIFLSAQRPQVMWREAEKAE